MSQTIIRRNIKQETTVQLETDLSGICWENGIRRCLFLNTNISIKQVRILKEKTDAYLDKLDLPVNFEENLHSLAEIRTR